MGTVQPPGVVLEPRLVPLGGVRAMTVRRTLPHREVRTVGAWCFVDHYGPQQVGTDGAGGMLVPPHPHTGLQTVTWLLEGEVVHDDSVGSHQVVRPGELNLMTAGHGIAHAEVSAAARPGSLHGVQLWVALPEPTRAVEPHFEHHADLPTVEVEGGTATVLLGELAGSGSPARTYSPIVGAVLDLHPGSRAAIPLDSGFEHGVIGLDGPLEADATVGPMGALVGFPPGREVLTIDVPAPTRVLLLGGEPFAEDLVMWWNFVARSNEEIVAARADWEAGRRFGEVAVEEGRLPAPPLPTSRLLPRRSRGLEPASA